LKLLVSGEANLLVNDRALMNDKQVRDSLNIESFRHLHTVVNVQPHQSKFTVVLYCQRFELLEHLGAFL